MANIKKNIAKKIKEIESNPTYTEEQRQLHREIKQGISIILVINGLSLSVPTAVFAIRVVFWESRLLLLHHQNDKRALRKWLK